MNRPSVGGRLRYQFDNFMSRGTIALVGAPVTFYTVLEAARCKGQTAIGYRLLAEASEPDLAFGVHMNPDKAAPVTFAEHDRIIVLAEQ